MRHLLQRTRLVLVLCLASLSVKSNEFTILTSEQVKWGYLNPLRGDKSPGAANLWGDRTKNTATGMLVRFKQGFASPPHIHNITYRGVVIEGLMHNDDPGAVRMWMPPESFWTQPAGEDHITAANGETNLIYLEIDSGPYLVKPTSEQFDNGERPLNLHKDNLVWLTQDDTPALEANGTRIAYLWGSTDKGKLRGTLLSLPTDFRGFIKPAGSEFRMVVIKGAVEFHSPQGTDVTQLLPGSYLGTTEASPFALSGTSPAIVYIRADDEYAVVSHKE